MSSKQAPRIERASEEQLVELLQAKDPALRQLYLQAHRLVLITLPDVMHFTLCKGGATGYGTRQYGYDGWGLAWVSAYTHWVSMTFMHGAELEDPAGLLEGNSLIRHVKLRSFDQFEQRKCELRRLLELAAKLHLGQER